MKSIVLLGALLLGACGRDPGDIDGTVGNACTSDRSCDDKCYMGGDFPGGFCSVACASDHDCPDGTFCMEAENGVCMFSCPDFDCTRLGPGWNCETHKRLNGGDLSVCSGG